MKLFSTGSHVWTLGQKLVMLFGEGYETLRKLKEGDNGNQLKALWLSPTSCSLSASWLRMPPIFKPASCSNHHAIPARFHALPSGWAISLCFTQVAFVRAFNHGGEKVTKTSPIYLQDSLLSFTVTGWSESQTCSFWTSLSVSILQVHLCVYYYFSFLYLATD